MAFRGVEDADHTLMWHEYVGVVEEVGDAVTTLGPGDFVVRSFVISDNTCEICRAGFQRPTLPDRSSRPSRGVEPPLVRALRQYAGAADGSH